MSADSICYNGPFIYSYGVNLKNDWRKNPLPQSPFYFYIFLYKNLNNNHFKIKSLIFYLFIIYYQIFNRL